MNLFKVVYEKYMNICLLYNKIYSFIISKIFLESGKNLYTEYPIYIRGENYISIGNHVKLMRNLRIEAYDFYAGKKYKPKIKIGNNVSINVNCHIGCVNNIIIGNNVLIGAGVLITDHSHGDTKGNEISIPPDKRKLYSKGKVIIKDNVWIGENVAILPGVTIGKSVIIGANSVITHDIPDNVIAAGNPIKIVRRLK